jgi:hypothetical protein
MEPSELYNRSKRTLVVFAAILALVLIGGVKPEEQGQILGFRISAPHLIPVAFVIIVTYSLYQYILAWRMQPDAVQAKIKHDFWLTTTIELIIPLSHFAIVAAPLLEATDLGTLLAWTAFAVSSATIAFAIFSREDRTKWRREAFSLRRQTIAQRLKQPGWILVFNKKHPNGSKQIEFLEGGKIGAGQNKNEYEWSLDGASLIIHTEDGSLQNRFVYDEATNQFVSTDDADAAATRRGTIGQYIFRE